MHTSAYLGTVNHHELGIEADANPTKAGRLAAAIDDGGLVGGIPADKGRVAAIVEANARLGKDNENAWKYRKSGITRNRAQCIHLKDAQYVDMYIYKR